MLREEIVPWNVGAAEVERLPEGGCCGRGMSPGCTHFMLLTSEGIPVAAACCPLAFHSIVFGSDPLMANLVM